MESKKGSHHLDSMINVCAKNSKGIGQIVKRSYSESYKKSGN